MLRFVLVVLAAISLMAVIHYIMGWGVEVAIMAILLISPLIGRAWAASSRTSQADREQPSRRLP